MKKILTILVIIIGAAIIGHYMLWKQQSERLSANAEQFLLKAQQVDGAEHVKLSYDDKETGGYPASVTIRYANPVLTIAPEFYSDKEDISVQLTRIALDGEMIVRNAYMHNSSAVEMTGALTLKGEENGRPLSLKALWDDVALCNVTLAGTPIDFMTGAHALRAAETFEQQVKALREAHCDTRNLYVKDMGNNADIMRIGKQNITFSSDESANADNHIIGLDVNIEEAEFFTSQSDMLAELQMQAGALNDQQKALIALVERHPIPLLDGRYAGAHTIRFTGTYDGPLHEEAFDNKDTSLALDIDRFAIDNKAYTASSPLRLDIDNVGDAASIFLRHEGNTRYTPVFDEAMQQSLDSIYAIIQSPELIVSDAERATLQRITRPMLDAVMPEFAALGTITTQVNMDIDRASDKVAVESLGFSSDKGGIIASGNGVISKKQLDADIVCSNCEGLLLSLMEYGNDVQRLVAVSGLMQQQKLMILPPEAQAAVVRFVSTLDTDKASDTITINVNTTPQGQMMISGQPAALVMMGAVSQLGPYFQPLLQ